MQLVWTILIGFIAGLIAKIVTPGTGPSGFWLTAALGVGGSILASYLGQWMGLYAAGEGSGFIGRRSRSRHLAGRVPRRRQAAETCIIAALLGELSWA